MTTTWETRDFRVLAFLFAHPERRAYFDTNTVPNEGLEELADLDATELDRSIRLLKEAGYLATEHEPVGYGTGVFTYLDLFITGDGMRVLGEWPPFDAFHSPEALAQLFERLASSTSGEAAVELSKEAARVRKLSAKNLRLLISSALNAYIRARTGG
jgi:hypothetical protein